MERAISRLPRWMKRWEWILVILILVVYAIFSGLQPENYTFPKLLNQTRVYMVDVGFMALGILVVLILGDIDISIGATAALSATVMAVTYNQGDGIPFIAAIALMLLTGAVCGLINGLLITRFPELFPMIITLSTQTLYRGIAYIILKDQSAGRFPGWFSKDLGYGSFSLFGLDVPIMLVCILAVLPVYYIWLHKSASGRRIFAAGTNLTASRYSGVQTGRIKMAAFILNGIMAALGGFFLTSRTGSVKYTLATGYEMQAIAIAVLGGASTSGGRGSVAGLLLALILMTGLKNGLMLVYNDAFILNLSIGLLLILIVLVPDIAGRIRRQNTVRRQRLTLKKT
ncbi:MAG: ABC transporter permease [Eubacteriales bacterium]|nr:ABC transporter permease [Eubacteriales bacterium]